MIIPNRTAIRMCSMESPIENEGQNMDEINHRFFAIDMGNRLSERLTHRT